MVSVPVKALVAAAAVTFALVGCTHGPDIAAGSASPPEAVATFMHALGNKNSDAACSQVSTGGQPLTDAGYDIKSIERTETPVAVIREQLKSSMK